ncbi:IS66 family insertion sequence element accessory protein TnpB, partial [Photobacterium proteolyticum]|uniref:IS66 family insertion sequence element accessory protein TnpB n=1 Tax=Photobacterium proteolyticum TaxID=1903952 RepID=UPI00111515EF
MKGLISPPAIYLYREFVDFRKSINGLAALVESETDLSLDSGALFLFTNKQRDKMKVLYWDNTGFALWYKRLEKDKFKWPSSGVFQGSCRLIMFKQLVPTARLYLVSLG